MIVGTAIGSGAAASLEALSAARSFAAPIASPSLLAALRPTFFPIVYVFRYLDKLVGFSIWMANIFVVDDEIEVVRIATIAIRWANRASSSSG